MHSFVNLFSELFDDLVTVGIGTETLKVSPDTQLSGIRTCNFWVGSCGLL